jgi:hypothetical protein
LPASDHGKAIVVVTRIHSFVLIFPAFFASSVTYLLDHGSSEPMCSVFPGSSTARHDVEAKQCHTLSKQVH